MKNCRLCDQQTDSKSQVCARCLDTITTMPCYRCEEIFPDMDLVVSGEKMVCHSCKIEMTGRLKRALKIAKAENDIVSFFVPKLKSIVPDFILDILDNEDIEIEAEEWTEEIMKILKNRDII